MRGKVLQRLGNLHELERLATNFFAAAVRVPTTLSVSLQHGIAGSSAASLTSSLGDTCVVQRVMFLDLGQPGLKAKRAIGGGRKSATAKPIPADGDAGGPDPASPDEPEDSEADDMPEGSDAEEESGKKKRKKSKKGKAGGNKRGKAAKGMLSCAWADHVYWMCH